MSDTKINYPGKVSPYSILYPDDSEVSQLMSLLVAYEFARSGLYKDNPYEVGTDKYTAFNIGLGERRFRDYLKECYSEEVEELTLEDIKSPENP
jgi:hypothetical protein